MLSAQLEIVGLAGNVHARSVLSTSSHIDSLATMLTVWILGEEIAESFVSVGVLSWSELEPRRAANLSLLLAGDELMSAQVPDVET